MSEDTPEEKEKRASTIRKKLTQLKEKAYYLQETDREYDLICVNGNYELKSDLLSAKTFARNSDITPAELGFIKKIKNYVIKNEIYLNFDKDYFSRNVTYMEASQKYKGQTLTDVVEIDIDQAYWETAYQLSVISKELYDQGKKGTISKEARMIALGSLAKTITHYKFKGRQMLSCKEERSTLTENIWFTICKRVSDVMREALNAVGDDYIFFWVDGMYVRGKKRTINRVSKVFAKYGYDSKVRKIPKIIFEEKTFTVFDDKDDETKIRKFNYVKARKRRSIAQDKRLKQLCIDTLSGVDPVKAIKNNKDFDNEKNK